MSQTPPKENVRALQPSHPPTHPAKKGGAALPAGLLGWVAEPRPVPGCMRGAGWGGVAAAACTACTAGLLGLAAGTPLGLSIAAQASNGAWSSMNSAAGRSGDQPANPPCNVRLEGLGRATPGRCKLVTGQRHQFERSRA